MNVEDWSLLKAPVAFEVARTDGDGSKDSASSIIESHPPRRIRRLEDEPHSNLSWEEVHRRQSAAEKRRTLVFPQQID